MIVKDNANPRVTLLFAALVLPATPLGEPAAPTLHLLDIIPSPSKWAPPPPQTATLILVTAVGT